MNGHETAGNSSVWSMLWPQGDSEQAVCHEHLRRVYHRDHFRVARAISNKVLVRYL